MTSDPASDPAIAQLARLIQDNQPCVALTGAGVSQESGIPTFRGPDPLSASDRDNGSASTESGIPDFRSPAAICEYATLGAFRRDPEKIWRFYGPRYELLTAAEPNRAHLALAELERRGLVRAVVTQNIDLLHERAGSREVVEVHGSIRTATCPVCGVSHGLDEIVARLEAGEAAPRCARCGAVVKPDVVFFDELLPEAEMARAEELARAAGLLLVVGSSLEVYPAADLPATTLAAGGRVAVVNRGPTWVDGRATVELHASAGEVLEAVVAALA